MNKTIEIPTHRVVSLALQVTSRVQSAQRDFNEAKDRMARHLEGAPDSFFIQAAKDLAKTAEALTAATETERMITGQLGAETLAEALGLLNLPEAK